MHDIRFPGWIKSSPTLVMASVLAQLLAEETAVQAAAAAGGSVPARPADSPARAAPGMWWCRHTFDEDIHSSSSSSGGGGGGADVCVADSDTDDVGFATGPGAGGDADPGYLRMVDRLLELNSKALDSLPPTAHATAAPAPRRGPTGGAGATAAARLGLGLSTAALFGGGGGGGGASSASSDILRDPRVRTLLRLSRLNEVLTRTEATQPHISQSTAASMIAFFAFAASCRHCGLPADRTKGFFTECGALYTTLLSKLRSLPFCAGVSLEDFTAALVVCGLKLRDDEDGDGDDKEMRSGVEATTTAAPAALPYSARSNSSSALVPGMSTTGAANAAGGGGGGRTPAQSSLVRDKNWGLVGFGHRALDATFVRCIPEDIDECVHDAVALGVLRGISLTHSQQLFYLGPELVNHMHDLTDAFATSGHRRQLSYKRVLSVLLEAISCSRVIDYERTNNWITAIIQETYVVRGLFQREELHAHVVTATLTLLIRQYQEMAKECAAKVVNLDAMPDFTEGDQLIELVWKALQDTIGSWEDAASAAEKRPLTLFRHNIDIVVQHLLRTELERLRCYYIITSATAAYHQSLVSLGSPTQQGQWRSPTTAASPALPPQGPHASGSQPGLPAAYTPSVEEESLRILICSNIVKFLLLPTSIMNALPRTEEADQLRASLTEAAARVLSVVTAREFSSSSSDDASTTAQGGAATALASGTPALRSVSPMSPAAGALPSPRLPSAGADLLAVSRQRAHFSNNFYRSVEEIMQELIETVLQRRQQRQVADDADAAEASQLAPPPASEPTGGGGGGSGDGMVRGMVAAVCMQYMCSTNDHLRSFATSEVMDAVVRLSARRGVEDAQGVRQVSEGGGHGGAAVDPESARRSAEQRCARRMALCFDAMSSILVPDVVDVDGGHHVAEAREERAGITRSSTTTSARGESKREELARYGQLLCDTYVDALREHLARVAEGTASRRRVVTPVMSVAVKAFVDLVLRVHERLRGMAGMALALVQEAEAAGGEGPEKGARRTAAAIARDRARLLHAFNAERSSVVLLLRGVTQCMLSVAWPASGVLYQSPADGGERPLDSTTASAVMAPIAFAVLSPLLPPLATLLHLSTLFPARSLKQLCAHHQYARSLTVDDPGMSDQYLFHYYRRPSRAYVAIDTDVSRSGGRSAEDEMELQCGALFRSCWMMLSYYKYTAEALLAVSDGGAAAASAALDRAPILSPGQCALLRRVAASAAPLLRMCSSDVQQAMGDIAVLLRYMLASERHRPVAAVEVASVGSRVHTALRKSLKRLCGGKKGCWKQLSTGELVLLQSIAELEMLRAAAGSVAQLTLYRHFEVREFVASPGIPVALGHILGTACDHYIRAVRNLLPGVAFQVVRTDLTQLVFLLSFAIASVRESASKLVSRVVHAFPTYAAYASALPLLWCALDLLESGPSSQIEAVCDHVHFAAVPAVAADPHSAERQRHLLFVAEVAESWAATLQDKAPQALAETAIKFIVFQQQECGERAAAQAGVCRAGSRLAVAASQRRVDEAPPTAGDASDGPVMRGAAAAGRVVASEYAQTLLLYGRAQGTMQAAGWYASAEQIEGTVLAQLWASTRLSRRALAVSVSQWLDATLLRPARALFIEGGRAVESVLTVGDAGVAQLPDRAEAAAGFAAAVALLVAGTGTATGRRQLLQYLVQGPVQTFRSDLLHDAILCWKWLLCQDREGYLLPVLQEVDAALVWTAANRLGLFDGYRASKNRQVQTGEVQVTQHGSSSGGSSSSSSSDAPGDAGASALAAEGGVAGASPHKLLLSFLADMYVEEGHPLCLSIEVLRQLFLVASHMMEFAAVLSLRDEMFGEMMRCLLVVGNVARLLREANARRLRAGLVVVVPFSAVGALRQRWYKALLRWFTKTPPSWYYAKDPEQAREEAKVVRSLSLLVKEDGDVLARTTLGFLDFDGSVQREGAVASSKCHWQPLSVVHESIVAAARRTSGADGEADLRKLAEQEQQRLLGLLRLLRVLVEHEVLRMGIWQAPRRTLTLVDTTPSTGWERLIEYADHHNPAVVVAMVYRFSSIPAVRAAASRCVVAQPERYANVAEAVDLYLTEDVLRAGAPRLFLFRASTTVQALRLLDPRYTAYKNVTSYAIRSLLSQRSEQLIFYLPQLLQLLATDKSGSIEAFLTRTSARSAMFAHQLLWSLQTEGEGSGALARKCQQLEKRVKASFTPDAAAFCEAEFAFVDLVTSLSGELMKFDKPERKAKLRLRLKDDVFHAPPRSQHLYLPTDPDFRITGVIPHTAGAMQSAAKCPILVQFTCVPREAEDTRAPDELATEAQARADRTGHGHGDAAAHTVVKACIFKMGDDCRQDQISLQLIGLMQRILCSVGVPSFLYPYRVVTTGQDSGIIECVPRSRSRNEIGKLVESNVAEFFVQTFGHPESVGFRRARENFVKSTAAYSVVSFILNIKDRHNGNIMIDADGNLVHIDFGFLFDTSPGGDINFESSPFKLTTEMVQLIGMDVRGDSKLHSKALARALVDEESYIYFKTLVNRCYLAVRQYAREICVLVELMLHSGLPCFKPKKTIADLARRLAIDKNEIAAADYMRRRIHESRQNYRTVLYDYYQKVAEGIEM